MDLYSLSRKDEVHKDFITDSYNSFICKDTRNVLSFTLQDNCIIKNVNSSMFRVFSPLITSILQDIPEAGGDIILPDFDEESFRDLIEVLSFGYTRALDDMSLNNLKSLAQCLSISMDNLSSDVRTSKCSKTFNDVPQFDYNKEPNNNNGDSIIEAVDDLKSKLDTLEVEMDGKFESVRTDLEWLKQDKFLMEDSRMRITDEIESSESQSLALDEANEKIRKLVSQTQSLEKVNKQLKQIGKVMKTRYLNEEAKVRNFEIERKKMVDEKSQLDNASPKLKEQLDQIKNLELQLKIRNDEIANQTTKIIDLEKQISSLKHTMQSNSDLRRNKLSKENPGQAIYEEETKVLKDELASYKMEVKKMKKKLANSKTNSVNRGRGGFQGRRGGGSQRGDYFDGYQQQPGEYYNYFY